MTLTAEWVMAICAGVTLLILWSTTVIGAAVWLMSKLNALKREILDEFNAKHAANALTIEAIKTLVIRHDTILDPEFNGTGKPAKPLRQQ